MTVAWLSVIFYLALILAGSFVSLMNRKTMGKKTPKVDDPLIFQITTFPSATWNFIIWVIVLLKGAPQRFDVIAKRV